MPSRKRSAWTWIVWTLLTLVLYVLSVGPALVLAQRYDLRTAHAIAYKPIMWLLRGPEPIEEMTVKYYRFCGAKDVLTRRELNERKEQEKLEEINYFRREFGLPEIVPTKTSR